MPVVAAASDGSKNPRIFLQGNPNHPPILAVVAGAALAASLALESIGGGRAPIFQALSIRLKTSVGHLAWLVRQRTVAKDLIGFVIDDVIRPGVVDQSRFLLLPHRANVNVRFDSMIPPQLPVIRFRIVAFVGA